jgi:hypothetical protein
VEPSSEDYRLVSIDEITDAIQEENQAVLLSYETLQSIREWLLRCREVTGQLLLSRMKELCAKYCHQPWIDGFEYSLWQAIVDGPEKLTEAEVTELDRLSSEAGGWWTWSGSNDDPLFMALNEWQKRYDHGHDSSRELKSQNEALQKRIKDLEAALSRDNP